MTNIKITDRNDPLVAAAKQLVRNTAIQSWVLLFEGERWYHIERVAIAHNGDENVIVGIASLEEPHEYNNNTPDIIGVWTVPERRRQGIGVQLVKALAEESMSRYGKAPKIVSATRAGHALVGAAERDNVGIVAINAGGFADLP
jgi:GNAT superfamily N-acetyltransferase